MSRIQALLAAGLLCVGMSGLGMGMPIAAVEDPVLVGAGDIAECGQAGAEQTAMLLDAIEGTVFTTGDNAYPDGSAADYANCYGPTWGRHKAGTRPAIGNHDYHTPGAPAYFDYFGAAAGEPGKGYYSYDLGAWHIVVLNSNCGDIDGCHAGSPQEQWLRADLAAHPATCTLAYFHHPRFSSGPDHRPNIRNNTDVQPFWQALYEAGADVVLAGHAHLYERFAPQEPDGKANPNGLRQFVVGTGGGGLYDFGSTVANSEVRYNASYGVLKVTLHPNSYDWQFVPVAGNTFSDTGSAACVGASAEPTPAIAKLTPSLALAGGRAFTLTVEGVNFASDATVRWNGANRPTTFESSTRLTATIHAKDIAMSGIAHVTVFNPTLSNTSLAYEFAIVEPRKTFLPLASVLGS
jgi:hypothetical protein